MNFRKLIFLALITSMFSCKKETQSLNYPQFFDYFPLTVGKTITYRVDSLVYLNFGTTKQTRTSIVLERVDSSFTDNIGRPTFKITRFLRQNDDTTKWQPLNTYRVTKTSDQVEVIEDNQRFIKLINPVIAGIKWKGNAKINTTGNATLSYLDNWEYTYRDVQKPFTLNPVNYPDCITVLQKNDTIGNPGNKNFYFEINYGYEVYAKQTGLLFKEILHEVWQPPNGSSNSGYYETGSFGLKFTILSNK